MKVIYPLVLFLFSIAAFADQGATAEGRPITAVRVLPNERELTPDDYAFLGKIVWNQLQSKADPGQRELNPDDIAKLIDDMHRSGDRISLDFSDLQSLLKSRQLWCGSLSTAPGIDLGSLGIKF